MYEIKLKNNSEQKVLELFKEKYGKDLTIIKGNDIPDVKWVKKTMKNKTVLIVNVKNPELPKTDLGNERTIEFCFINNNVIYWIDVQHLSKPSAIQSVIHDKIIATVDCKDNYLFPVDGFGYTDNNIKRYSFLIKKVYSKARVFRIENLLNQLK